MFRFQIFFVRFPVNVFSMYTSMCAFSLYLHACGRIFPFYEKLLFIYFQRLSSVAGSINTIKN